MRSDAPLIKGLAKNFGHAVAAEWQKRPCVMLDDIAQTRIRRWARDLDGNPGLSNLPWNDFIITLETAEPKPGSDLLSVFLRIATEKTWCATVRTMSPWDKIGRVPEPYSDGTVVQMFAQWTSVHDVGDVLMRNGGILTFVDKADRPKIGVAENPWLHNAKLNLDGVLEFAERFTLFGLLASAYLAQCPDFIVETRRARPSDPKTLKTAKAKPWLRDDLPSFVLIDPEKCHLYRDRPDLGGTHASPRPHHRRGHYKTLTHERYYTGYDPETGKPWRELFDPNTKPRIAYVHPTIVGDPEWVFQGTHYKVINADQA